MRLAILSRRLAISFSLIFDSGGFAMSNHTSPADEAFFAAVGRLTLSWGHLGIALDSMVEIMYHGFGGREIEPEMPRQLQRKITFLRKAFKKLPIGQKAIQGYLALFDQIEAAAQTRHDIIHGAVIEYAERSGEATMVRVTRHGERVTKKRFKVTTRSIFKAAIDAQKLGSKVFYWLNEFHAVAEKLLQQRDEQNPS